MNGVIRRVIAESGRYAVLTPGGTSGYAQPCDSNNNAAFNNGFMKVRK